MASSQNPINTYYRPYLPDSESEASEYSDISPPTSPRPDNAGPDISEDDITRVGPDFTALAQALKGPSSQAGGPTFETIEENDTYAVNRIDKNVYGPYPLAVSSGEPIKMQATDVPTVIILQSVDRDRKIFPQPTDCRLMLPRVYQNIGGFSIAQINLTSAFFYFNTAKSNVSLQIYEQDRIIYDPIIPTLTPTSNTPLKPINTIRDGSYDINSLMTELQLQLNRTPKFYDFINGFSDFASIFPISGDMSLNFNEPGDNYYDSLSKKYIANPTRETICSYYFQSRYVLNTTFTIQQVLVAYYYPILKEILLDPNTKISGTKVTWNSTSTYSFNLDYLDSSGNQIDVYNYILYFFTGIDDPIIQSFTNNTSITAILDTYRLFNTFRYSLVNQYSCTTDPANNRVTIQAIGLNTSLSNYLVNKYNAILSQQITANGLSLTEYNNLTNTVIATRAVYQQMYTVLQNAFAKYFAVDYGTYSGEYYINSNNSFILRPGINAFGVSYSYNLSNTPRTSDIMNDFKKEAPSYWPYMTNMPGRQGAQVNMGTTVDPFPISSNFPYSLAQSNIQLNRNFIDSNGYIYTDYRRKSGDILVNVEANKYTIFKFRSQYRQSLQVESLPRQTAFRYPVWNKDIANKVAYPIATLFDVSYCYVAPDPNTMAGSNMLNRDISFNAIYGWSNDIYGNPSDNFGTNFQTSLGYWGSVSEQINISNSNGRVYKLRAPFVNTPGIHKYQLNLNFYSSNTFPIDYYAFLYHDIAALAADVSPVGRTKESPYNFKQSTIVAANSLSNGFTINAYAGQTYYALFRPSIPSPPATFYQVVPSMSNSFFSTLSTDSVIPSIDPVKQLSNYNAAIQADPDFIRLPIVSSIWASNSPANSFVNFNLSNFVTPIGYDLSGVSTDLTDYIPFFPYDQFSTINPIAKYRVDPITNFVFQYNTPYNDDINTYFAPGTSNVIFTEQAIAKYTPNTVAVKQYKFAQYYNTVYIHDTANISYSNTSINSNLPTYNISTTGIPLGGYKYISEPSKGNPLDLGEGLCGFTFLPSDGLWAVDRLTYKTNFTVPSDPGNMNNSVHCLALFYTSEIYSFPVTNAKLSNAIGIFLRVSEQTYTEANTNLGFDSGFGTYYTFSNYPSLVTRSNATITGFTQTPGQLITDLSSYYSILAFTLNDFNSWSYPPPPVSKSNLTNITVAPLQNIVGTPIPYPYGSAISTSSVFYDGHTSPTGADMVVASPLFSNTIFGPPVFYGDPAQSVSQYEQSIPFVNSHVHYKLQQNIISDPNGFSAWSSLPVIPDYIHASVFNSRQYSDDTSTWINGYMLFQKDSLALASYKIYTSLNNLTLPDRDFTYMSQIGIQQIFPDIERTALIAVSGNLSNFVFVGLTQNYQLRFKLYEPLEGVVTELPVNSNYIFGSNYILQHFVFNGSNGWYYSARVGDEVVLAGTPKYSFNTVDSNYRSYRYTGSHTELQMPPGGQNLYFSYYTSTANEGFSNFLLFPLNPALDRSIVAGGGYLINLDTDPVLLKPYYTQMSVTLNLGAEEILFTNSNLNPNIFYRIRDYSVDLAPFTSNTFIDYSIQTLVNTSNQLVTPKRIMGGAYGSKWLISDTFPYVMGNRNDAFDCPIALGLAWQIFFPTMKIEMRKLGNSSTNITDLTGLTYPEWPHTAMFSYSNYDSMVLDISNNWGLEKNFMTSDVGFSGYYFNSYLVNIPLQDTSDRPVTDSNAFTYLAVRGYLPTESFQCMLRFNLPSRYDFGFISITDLIEEIPLTQTETFKFNPSYSDTILRFDSNFNFSNVNFGASAVQGLPGVKISSSNFEDFMTQYVSTYSNFSTNSIKLQIIQSTLTNDMTLYISTNMKYILPANALSRTRFTDPLLFQVLWQSYLTPSYSILDDNWGLGWNLGFAKIDTGMSTYQTAQSFYKIQEEYIYLKLNQEFNINGIDTGSKENYTTSREPTGATKQYYCKLLLTNFGGNATTFIHNPITFTPPLNRLTNLQFQWLDTNGVVINNNDSDWDMTITLTERYEIPVLPTKMPFTVMSVSDVKNENSAKGAGATGGTGPTGTGTGAGATGATGR